MRADNSRYLACPQQWKNPTMVKCKIVQEMHHKIGLETIATVTVNSSMKHAAVFLRLVPIPLGQTTFFSLSLGRERNGLFQIPPIVLTCHEVTSQACSISDPMCLNYITL